MLTKQIGVRQHNGIPFSIPVVYGMNKKNNIFLSHPLLHSSSFPLILDHLHVFLTFLTYLAFLLHLVDDYCLEDPSSDEPQNPTSSLTYMNLASNTHEPTQKPD